MNGPGGAARAGGFDAASRINIALSLGLKALSHLSRDGAIGSDPPKRYTMPLESTRRARPDAPFLPRKSSIAGRARLSFSSILRVEEGCRRCAAAERSVSVKAFRLTCFALAATAFCAATAQAAPASDTAAPAPIQSAQKPDKAPKPE